MRIGLLSLALTLGLSGMAAAESVPPLPLFLVAPGAALLGEFSVTENRAEPAASRRTGGDARDIVFGDADVARPMPRPSRLEAPVRRASASRRIERMPWTTGVFQ